MASGAGRTVTVVPGRWLALRFEAPLMAFGGVAVDQVGPVRAFPAASMLVGLIGNALGWHWRDTEAHQQLQDRLVFAARCDREGTALTDIQNAWLGGDDRGWTTRGRPEGRKGASYADPHRRRREYRADAAVRVVLALEPEKETPELEDVAAALKRPARPLFLGRKLCLPAAPVIAGGNGGWVEAATAHAALRALPGGPGSLRAQWPAGEGPEAGAEVERVLDVADLRNWRTGLHGGTRRVVEGRVIPRAGA